ncbi:MAG: DUF2335 domain-containing protein [Thermoguttaceae bacterium]|jgi:uncharacterized membrane protein
MSRRSNRKNLDAGEKPQLTSPDWPLSPKSFPPGNESSHIQISSQATNISSSFSGPLPPPNILEQYNKIVPGAAERIIAQAERQTEHRINIESKVIDSEITRSSNGLIAGTIVALACIIGGCLLVYAGHDWAGATIATASVVGLVGVFIYGTSIRRMDRAEKRKELLNQK